MRKEAWDAVVRTKWLWRLAWIFMILNLVLQLAMSIIGGAFVEMGIPTWMEFAKAKFAAAQQGLTYAVPSLSAALQMTGAREDVIKQELKLQAPFNEYEYIIDELHD